MPWAYYIVHGYKPIEYRSWLTRHRGALAIHASRSTADIVDDSTLADFCKTHGKDPDSVIKEMEAMCGLVIGTVSLVDVEGEPGDYHWVLRDPALLPSPFPVQGATTLFNVDIKHRLRVMT